MSEIDAEEKLVERVARAIYDQPTTFDGDTIATHLALSQNIDASASSVDESREVVMGVCRDAARVAVALVKAVREVKG